MSDENDPSPEDDFSGAEETEDFDEDVEEIFDEEYEFTAEDWEDLPEEEASKLLRGIEALIPDIVKRSVISGLGSTLLSEEGVRSLVADKNLPREAAAFLLSQADSTRREILRIISREIRVFLENMDFGGEIAKILTSLSFEVRTEVRFIPNEERVKPNIRNRVRIKRRKSSDGEEELFEEFEDVSGDEASSEKPQGQASGRKGGPERESKGKRRWTRKRKKKEAAADHAEDEES